MLSIEENHLTRLKICAWFSSRMEGPGHSDSFLPRLQIHWQCHRAHRWENHSQRHREQLLWDSSCVDAPDGVSRSTLLEGRARRMLWLDHQRLRLELCGRRILSQYTLAFGLHEKHVNTLRGTWRVLKSPPTTLPRIPPAPPRRQQQEELIEMAGSGPGHRG